MKNIFRFALPALASLCLVACSDDDNNGSSNGSGTTTTVKGVYVLSEGSYYSKLNGDLTSYDPETKVCTNSVFESANERSLTGTCNDGLVYGSKLYIANTDENLIEVVDAKTAKSLKQITLKGARCLEAYNGNIYATSFYDNQVVKIDTTNYSITGTVATGAYPEGMAVLGGTLYVANSGYGSGNTVTTVDLGTFKLKGNITVSTNPVEFATDGTTLFLLCSGKYKADYTGYDENPAVYTLDAEGAATKIADATNMALGNGSLYLINNNYYSTTGITYSVYSLSTKAVAAWTPSELPFSPYTIGVNPTNGDVYIASYNSIDYGDGKLNVNYNGDCYVMRYDKNGAKLDKFACGVNPGTIIFF